MTFDIRKFVDNNILRAAKEKDKYFCPICDGHNLSVDMQTGAYKCWNGCECSDIREALSPSLKSSNHYSSHSHNKKVLISASQKQSQESQSQSAPPPPVPESKELAKLPEIPKPIESIKEGNQTTIKYQYSETQWVKRLETIDSETGKIWKKFCPHHLDELNNVVKKKGSNPWPAYKLDEVLEHGKNKVVFCVEGEKCVEAMRQLGLVAFTFQAYTEKEIKYSLSKIKSPEVGLIAIIPDNDQTGLNKASKVEKQCIELKIPFITIDPKEFWTEIPEKGDVADWIDLSTENELIDEYIKELQKALDIAMASNPFFNNSDSREYKRYPCFNHGDLANYFAETYRDQLAFNIVDQNWYRYSAEIEGIWSVEPDEFVMQLFVSEIDRISYLWKQYDYEKSHYYNYTSSLVASVIKLTKSRLSIKKWGCKRDRLPFLNGVLNIKTKVLEKHTQSNRLTWCIPYNYDKDMTSKNIIDWLLTMCGGDEKLVQLMRAFLSMLIHSRTDAQKYLELIGPGGTGKSTFLRLAIALVGLENYHTTTLKKLEENRFETASIHGKRLLLITDSDHYVGQISTLKAITGQDTIPFEQKYKQSQQGFKFNGIVMVAANEQIQSSDYTSGLERRRVTIPFINKILSKQQRNLIEFDTEKNLILGEFADSIPGLMNWVLELDPDEAVNMVKNHLEYVPSLKEMKTQNLIDTNPIADWLDHNVVYDPETKTYVGIADKIKDDSGNWIYRNLDNWLYANYCQFAEKTNPAGKPISMKRFSNLLFDLCKYQLGLQVQKFRDRKGTYFESLKIRTDSNNEPPLITKNYNYTDKTEFLRHTIEVVTDTKENVTDSVMGQTLASDGCDGCDGLFEKQSINKLKQENFLNVEKVKNKIPPSQPSQEIAETLTQKGCDGYENDLSQPITTHHDPSQPITIHHNPSQEIAETLTQKGCDGYENDLSQPITIHHNPSQEIAETLTQKGCDGYENDPSQPITTSIDLSKVDYMTFPRYKPYDTNRPLDFLMKDALKLRSQILACGNKDELDTLAEHWKNDQIYWVQSKLLTSSELNNILQIKRMKQLTLDIDNNKYSNIDALKIGVEEFLDLSDDEQLNILETISLHDFQDLVFDALLIDRVAIAQNPNTEVCLFSKVFNVIEKIDENQQLNRTRLDDLTEWCLYCLKVIWD